MTSAVGIEDIGTYFGVAQVSVVNLFARRGLDERRVPNLMMVHKSVALPCEDIVTYAVNAASPVIERLSPQDRAKIETLVVATESGVDLAKSAAAAVHRWLGLSKNCRVFEVKQACHGGVAALQVVAASLAASPERDAKALVIAGDLPIPVRHSYAEPSQGSGAVALLLGEPRLATWHPGRHGSFSFDNIDFYRPDINVDIIDIDLSILSYLDCLIGSYKHYADATPADFVTSFDALAMHTPFPGMVKGAHRTAIRRLSALDSSACAEDFEKRVQPSLNIPSLVGNIYSGCTLMAMVSSLLYHRPSGAHTLGLYSYGGGCSSEFLSLTVSGEAEGVMTGYGFDKHLAGRTELSIDRYDAILDEAPRTAFGVRDVDNVIDGVIDLTAATPHKFPLLMLESIRDYERHYVWQG
jgi:polyketide biosynthesis 3-hydroxy-3-methylglutaryl-CoA synthase-like enzyme PksG